MRDGTAGTALGEPRTGITRSPLRAGCFSHLGKPYVEEAGTGSGNGIPPSPPHTFFTRPHRGAWERTVGRFPAPR
ncbi:hypothetical protein F750_5192 [Streptomyces sp. PAMC 26508]|nr:hypothetical protein F750_5192 [Streptomyces sp. PAMC 26508]